MSILSTSQYPTGCCWAAWVCHVATLLRKASATPSTQTGGSPEVDMCSSAACFGGPFRWKQRQFFLSHHHHTMIIINTITLYGL
jgi:hypothetical protein